MSKWDTDIPEILPHRKKPWNKKKCKKNKGKNHIMVKVATKHFSFLSTDDVMKKDTWEEWKCCLCGKKEIVSV